MVCVALLLGEDVFFFQFLEDSFKATDTIFCSFIKATFCFTISDLSLCYFFCMNFFRIFHLLCFQQLFNFLLFQAKLYHEQSLSIATLVNDRVAKIKALGNLGQYIIILLNCLYLSIFLSAYLSFV